MADPKSLGATGAPFPFIIERGAVRAFARATHGDHPSWAGPRPLAPPTFLTTAFHWEREVDGANPWELVRMDPARGVHAEQSWLFHGPPPVAGDELLARSRIARFEVKPRRDGGGLVLVTMLTEFHTLAGDLRAVGVLVGAEVVPPGELDLSPGRAEVPGAVPELVSPVGEPPGATGDALGVRDLGPVTRTDFVRYQGASGDLQPVHHDEQFALAAGHPAPLGVGMYVAGALANHVAAQVGPERVREVRLRFRAPVYPGHTVRLGAEVVQASAGGRVARGAAVRTDGVAVVEGTFRFAS